ncbi:MAG: hypothetical protein HETSPECPRED_009291 [Heterodermia speciosa]|uniref:Uncharacterized protein n=1 Tax=Heterodermia speciosa TaxID=116794 RepID=A0A8H3G2L6_9LECA|nr:MAG: hypothetical protein HETSPECPRED_009291 [Heterodermia speciosa]
MEEHTYADALRKRPETARRDLLEGTENSSTLVSDVKSPNPDTSSYAVVQSQTGGNDKASVTMKTILAGNAIEAASKDPIPPSSPRQRAFLPEDLYYLHQILELYRLSMKTIQAWLAWEGCGSPGNTAQPTSRLLELAQRARWRGAVPSARELWALEVALDCAKVLQRVEEGEGESKNGQQTLRTSGFSV